jgi:tetratricopeptide (TPR) repeat protein
VSPRTRVRLVAGAAALAAVGIAVGATLMGRGDEPEPAPRVERGPPPLELGISLRNDAEARELRAAERLYDDGDAAEARERLESVLEDDPESLEAAVGAAITSWPDGTVGRLEALAEEEPRSALVRLHLGLAYYAAGQDSAATAQWREALQTDPDSAAALRAEDLLHPDMAPGRPYFYARFKPPQGLGGLSPARQLEELRARAEAGGVQANLLYGAALQRAGRPVAASAAFTHALELDPDDLDARVADAVGRFEKAEPAAAFSRLGPLAGEHPRSGVVRFHLGLLLLWIRDVKGAKAQLERAAKADPHGFYGREAKQLLSRLEAIRT